MDINELYSGMRAALGGPVDAATIDLLATEAARYGIPVQLAGRTGL